MSVLTGSARAVFVVNPHDMFRCVEACAVLRKLDERTRFVWPRSPQSADAEDRRAAFGHLVEGLLQRELPEVHNAFKVSATGWTRVRRHVQF